MERRKIRFTLEADESAESPSVKCGMTPEDEEAARAHAARFIQELGVLLDLPQVTIAKALVLMHRWCWMKPMNRYNLKEVSEAALLLASKLDDREKPVDSVVHFCHCLAKNDFDCKELAYPTDREFRSRKHGVVSAESMLLRDLGFFLHVEDTYKYVVFYVYEVLCEKIDVLQLTWSYLTDSYRTDACVHFEPDEIALGCIYLALRKLGKRYPEGDGTAENPSWWQLFDVSTEKLVAVVKKIARAYIIEPRPCPTKKDSCRSKPSRSARSTKATQDTQQSGDGASPEYAPPSPIPELPKRQATLESAVEHTARQLTLVSVSETHEDLPGRRESWASMISVTEASQTTRGEERVEASSSKKRRIDRDPAS
ncbi:Cyclin-L1-1 [Diplonema papillatum]|nr:Cyclin-L1-1 [Diplonema papillatum]